MDKVTGRSDDLIILRGVNVFPSQIEEHIVKIDGIGPHYQVEAEQGRAAGCRLTVRVEPRRVAG